MGSETIAEWGPAVDFYADLATILTAAAAFLGILFSWVGSWFRRQRTHEPLGPTESILRNILIAMILIVVIMIVLQYSIKP